MNILGKKGSVGLLLTGFVMLLVLGCQDSGPTESEKKKTVSYKAYVGQWEGDGPYHVDNPWDADSIYVTHFEVNKGEAVIGDTVGHFKLNNKDEYCWGSLLADEQQEQTTVLDFNEAKTDSCGGGRGELFLTYYIDNAGEKVLNIEGNPAGEADQEYIWYSATLHSK